MNDVNKKEKELTLQEMLEEEGLPPFITRPKKQDIVLWACIIGITILSFALIPLRIWFLNNPEWYAVIIGGYTSATLIGANSAIGQSHPEFVLLTLVGALKFIPVYYFVGKLWGRDFLDYSLQYMPRIHKWMTSLLDNKSSKVRLYSSLMTPIIYLPFIRISYAILTPIQAIAKMSLPLILLVNGIGVLIVNYSMFGIGYIYGKEVLQVLEVINKYAGWITFGLITFVFVSIFIQQDKKKCVDDSLESPTHEIQQA